MYNKADLKFGKKKIKKNFCNRSKNHIMVFKEKFGI